MSQNKQERHVKSLVGQYKLSVKLWGMAEKYAQDSKFVQEIETILECIKISEKLQKACEKDAEIQLVKGKEVGDLSQADFFKEHEVAMEDRAIHNRLKKVPALANELKPEALEQIAFRYKEKLPKKFLELLVKRYGAVTVEAWRSKDHRAKSKKQSKKIAIKKDSPPLEAQNGLEKKQKTDEINQLMHSLALSLADQPIASQLQEDATLVADKEPNGFDKKTVTTVPATVATFPSVSESSAVLPVITSPVAQVAKESLIPTLKSIDPEKNKPLIDKQSPSISSSFSASFFSKTAILKGKPAISAVIEDNKRETIEKKPEKKLKKKRKESATGVETESVEKKPALQNRTKEKEILAPERISQYLKTGQIKPLLALKDLSDYRVDIFKGEEGRNLLHVAIEQFSDSPAEAKAAIKLLMTGQGATSLLDKPARLIDAIDEEESYIDLDCYTTPLGYCSHYGLLAAAEVLLDCGANCDGNTKKHVPPLTSPLVLAVRQGDEAIRMTNLLLKYHADPNLGMEPETPPLALALMAASGDRHKKFSAREPDPGKRPTSLETILNYGSQTPLALLRKGASANVDVYAQPETQPSVPALVFSMKDQSLKVIQLMLKELAKTDRLTVELLEEALEAAEYARRGTAIIQCLESHLSDLREEEVAVTVVSRRAL